MQQFLHKVPATVQAIAAGLLLGPFAYASTYNERWPILVLSLCSVAIIVLSQSPVRHTGPHKHWGIFISASLILIGLLLEVDKLVLLGGAIVLCSGLLSQRPISWPAAFFATLSACMMVPLPANIETAIAAELASLEASLFVMTGQAANLPIRLSGAQVFFEQSVVTINQDCSGTLLLVPAFMGAMVAAALTKSKSAAVAAIVFAAPIALLINLFRLGLVLFLIAQGSYEDAETWHDLLGFFALTVSWALPIILFIDLESVKVDTSAFRKFVPTLAVVAACALAINLPISTKSDDISTKFALPSYIAGWIAEPLVIPSKELKILNADQVSRQKYTSGTGELIVTAMHHLDPSIGREHSSERCFKAMGWQVETLSNRTEGAHGALSHMMTKSGGHSQSVLELEIDNQPGTIGLVRIQLVANAATPTSELQTFLEAFATKLFGEPS